MISAQTVMMAMSVAEVALWSMLGILFWEKKLQGHFPTMGWYLALRAASAPLLLFLYCGATQKWHHFSNFYFIAYYLVFVTSAVFLFFVSMEVFRSAFAGFSGLLRLGTVVFRWTLLVSVIMSISTVSFRPPIALSFRDISFNLMRSMSILELCLLGFLCLSMNELRLPVRSLAFGIALGFGIMSANEFVTISLITNYTKYSDPIQLVYESVILLVLGMWVTWCALPEPVRKPVVIPVTSTIYRWNEIATAFGHTGTKVAVQPSSGFFLSDVERVVEKVLTHNLKDRESES